MKKHWHVVLPVVLMIALVATRWPGFLPENFSAVYALVFCAAIFFPGKLGWWLPLLAVAISDVLVNVLHYGASPFHPYIMIKTVALFGAVLLAKFFFTPQSSFTKMLGGGIVSAFIFYFVTNTASWLYDVGYSKSLAGWWQALTVGLPGYPPTWEFFRNTLLSGGLFTAFFAGAMKLGEVAEEKTETDEEQEPEHASPEEA